MALYIGLMSGTSIDGVDGVLAELDDTSLRPRRVLQHLHACRLTRRLGRELLALNQPGPDELHRAALAANALMDGLYAGVVKRPAPGQQAGLHPAEVTALGAHGQTVRHRPLIDDAPGYTLQLANGARLAERSGIDVVCDFRSRRRGRRRPGRPAGARLPRRLLCRTRPATWPC